MIRYIVYVAIILIQYFVYDKQKFILGPQAVKNGRKNGIGVIRLLREDGCPTGDGERKNNGGQNGI